MRVPFSEADFQMSDGEDELGSSNAESANESESDHGNADSDDGDDELDVDALDGAGNVGWANTFAKVLQQDKPKDKKYLVLSKAKKLADKKAERAKVATKSFNFEIENGKGVKAESTDDEEKPCSEELEELAIIAARKERNNKLLALRVKPSVMDRDRERTFKRIATKGLVQLFNAVRSQQRDLVDKLEQAGPLDHRRDAVLNNINKRQFLDVLMGGKRAQSENVDNIVKDEDVKNEEEGEGTGKKSEWSVLRYALSGIYEFKQLNEQYHSLVYFPLRVSRTTDKKIATRT